MSDNAIECRTAVELTGLLNNEITYLPSGIHAITPASGGIGKPITVLVNQESALRIEEQRRKLMAKGKRPYFDFNHEDGKSSFWPESFVWRDGEGVVAKGDWSQSGRAAVKGKDFRAFSPVFYVDNKLGDPAKVVCRETAKPNMGGLVNDPAFSNLPLWAKNDGKPVIAGATGATKQRGETRMSMDETATLRAKNQELEDKVRELQNLVNSGQDDEATRNELKAAEAQLEANEVKIQLRDTQSQLAVQNEEIRAARERRVEAALSAAIGKGAIPPRDTAMKASLKASAMADESFIKTIEKLPGRTELGIRLTGESSRYTVQSEEPTRILCKMAELAGRQLRATKAEKKMLSQEFQAIYANEVSPITAQSKYLRVWGTPMQSLSDAIMATDNTDANLGILSGTLVTQRVLELLKFTFPPLAEFTTDFSDQPAQYAQTIVCRTVTIPTVQTYSTASGWSASTAATTDVPVTINQHKGVQITFNENILASTVRRLFSEFAEAQAYALGKDMMDALYANITDANFTNNSVVASASFSRSSVVDIENALDKRGVPYIGRTMLLYADTFAALEKDSTMLQPFAYFAPQVITEGRQPDTKFRVPLSSFSIYKAVNLPTNNGNVNGFAGSKSALIIATRVPNDYTSILPGASFGNVSMVTDPDIGITVMLVQYVSHDLATATSRIALMYGTAAGQGNAGQLIKANAGSGSSH